MRLLLHLLLGVLTVESVYGASALIALDIDASTFERGIMQDGESGTFYLRATPNGFDYTAYFSNPGGFLTTANSVNFGTYAITQSLTVSQESVSLGNLVQILTDGSDDYMQFILVREGSIIVAQKKESEWFGLTDVSGLQGGSVVATEFRVNEIRSQVYAPPFNMSALDVYYLDVSLQIQVIPEPAGLTLIFAGLASGAIGLRRRKRTS